MSVDTASLNGVKVYDVKACRSCAQSKTKCIATNLSVTSCDRCYRLNKQCVPQTPHERKPRGATRRKNRIRELEQRLDQLSRTVEREKAYESPETETSSNSPAALKGSGTCTRNARPVVSEGTPVPSQISTGSGSWQTLMPSQNQDVNALIEVYRSQCARFFPFVPVPDCSVDVWREKHPFLLGSICLVASYKDRAKQSKLSMAIIDDACTRSLLRGEKSLDLLQGLLVYLSWYHCYIVVQHHSKSQVSNLLSLCVALVADLGLNRPSHRNDRRRLVFDVNRKSYGFAEIAERWTTDEKLALLGCFYVSVFICVCQKRLDAIPYTSHIDDIRKSLLAEGQAMYSCYIDFLVRIQAIAYKIDKSLPYNTPTDVWQFTAPIGMHVESLRAELTSLRNSVPAALKTESLLELHICTAEIYLHEVSLYDIQWRDPSAIQSPQRLDMLYACLRSTKKYFDTFLSIPNSDFRTIPCNPYSQLAFALIVCSRLSVLELPGWNSNVVRMELDFSVVLGSIIRKLEAMNTLAKAEWTNGEEEPLWQRLAHQVGRIKTWFDAQKAETNGLRLQDQLEQQHLQPQQLQVDMGLLNDPTFGFMDNLEMGGGLTSDWFQGWPN